jgi:beta-galactosidase
MARRDGDNELLVGIRAHSLFDRHGLRYPKMRAPYPCGSTTEQLAGIWQDVFLMGLPPVRVSDVFLQPLVDQGVLQLQVSIDHRSEEEEERETRRARIGWEGTQGRHS